MATLTAHKTRLHVNNKQAAMLSECVGVRRVAFNFALGKWQQMYELWKADNTKPKPSAFDIDKIFNASKKQLYPWMYDDHGKLIVPSCVGQEAIKADIKSAFNNFFRRVKAGENPGYPKFKKRGMNESFAFTSTVINNSHINGTRLTLPKGWGTATLGEIIKEGKIKSTTISRRADKWWVSFLLEGDYEYAPCGDEIVGVDVRCSNLAILSDGRIFEGADAIGKHENKLAKLQRQLAKMERGSNRYLKQKARIAKLHKHIADIRLNNSHQATKKLATEYGALVIEDLDIKKMTESAKGTIAKPGKGVRQKSRLNKMILNQGFFEFKRQLEYKTLRHGSQLVKINPAYTSQTCSACGFISKSNIKPQAVFNCGECGHIENSHSNAAKNILKIGVSTAI